MNRALSFPFAVFLSLLASACAAPPAPFQVDGGPWISALQRDHPLAGKIWSRATGSFVTSDQLVHAASKSDFVLLGEKHDNEDHHRIQAWIVTQLFARGQRPALAFEMFTVDQADALRNYLARRPRDAAGLGPALGWEQRGWPAWRQYQPIAQAALNAGAPIVAADLARPTINAISKEGARALGERLETKLALNKPMPDKLTRSLRQEIVVAHCDQLPASMIDPMVTVMQARDANMADVLIDGAALEGRDGAILITGKGHARRDYGVPYHLNRLAPGQKTLSIAMVEVAEHETDPSAYAARFNANVLPYDYVWFTPHPVRDPACERFADQLRNAKDRHENKGVSE
jgi:uncharacterized iron-regulated protein